MNATVKAIVSWVVLLATVVLLYNVFTNRPSGKLTELTFSKFLEEVGDKNVKRVRIIDSDLTGEFISGGSFKTVIPADYPALYDKLQGVDMRIEHTSPNPWTTTLAWWAPLFLFVGLLIFFVRQLRNLTLQKRITPEPHPGDSNLVQLDPDVAKAFTNANSVNEALRLVIQLTELRGTA